jgi:CheY-like chemotaxis protein
MSTILVVDDDPTCRELLRRLIPRTGHTVVVATDGRDALDTLTEHPPHLILLDLAMPRMDGLTFLRHLRELQAHKETPVILCTALATRDIVRIAASLGVRDYLLKSDYTMQVLLERIERYLPRSARHAPAQSVICEALPQSPPA